LGEAVSAVLTLSASAAVAAELAKQRRAAAVWKLALQPTPKLLLLALADIADQYDTCEPKVDYLVERVGVTRMTIFVSIKSLEDGGLLRVLRRPGHASVYQIVAMEAARK
jgi:GTP-sensing pleiotropic transcriptional regulator CodY